MLYLIELQYISERVYVRIWSKLTVYLQPRQDQTFRSSAQLGQKYKVNLEIPTLEILIHNQLSFSRSLLITNIICWLVCSVFFLLQGCHFNWDSILTKYIIWYIHIYSAPTEKKNDYLNLTLVVSCDRLIVLSLFEMEKKWMDIIF